MGAERKVSEWQAAQLVGDGRVAQALRQLGYQMELTWYQPYPFQPKLTASDGRQQRLITLLDNGQGQGYAAWRVKPAPGAWQEVVQAGLQTEAIAF